MIFEALFAVFRTILTTLLDLLPTWEPIPLEDWAEDVIDALAPAFDLLAWVNQYVPVDQVLLALALVLSMYGALYIWSAVLWALTKLHILGGSS